MGGGFGLQGVEDHGHHAFSIVENVVIPESKNSVAVLSEISRASAVVDDTASRHMTGTIQLNDQFGLKMSKVGKIRTDGSLPAKMALADWQAPQGPPQPTLRVGHVPAQLARAWHASVRLAFLPLVAKHAPHP